MSKNLLFLLAAASASESVPVGWILLLGGVTLDFVSDVSLGDDGVFFISGSQNSQGAGGYDAFAARINPDGSVAWQNRWGSAQSEVGNAVQFDPVSKDITVVGQTMHTSNNGAYIIRLDGDDGAKIGNQRRLAGVSGTPVFSALGIGSDEMLVAVGTGTAGSSGSDIMIVKYSGTTLQWQRRLYGPTTTTDNGYGVTLDASDNVIVVGDAAGVGTAGCAVVAKYNYSGTLQWQRTLDGAQAETLYGVVTDSSGNVYVVGQSNAAGIGRALIAKYNSSGAIQWQRTLTGVSATYFEGIALTPDGDLLCVGVSGSAGLLALYDASGAIQWQRTITPSSGVVSLRKVKVDADGRVTAVGSTTADGAGSTDMFLLSINLDIVVTGAYGVFVFAAGTLTDAAGTLTDAAGTLTSATTTLTDSTVTQTVATATLTPELILLE